MTAVLLTMAAPAGAQVTNGGDLPAPPLPTSTAATGTATPSGFDAIAYRAILAQIDAGDWTNARAAVTALDESDPLRAYLLAQIYVAKGSPKAELFDLLDLLAKAPYLPQAEQIGRLAAKRGAQVLPDRPQMRQLMYVGTSPQRRILTPVKGDPLADSLAPQVGAFIKSDNPLAAEGLIDSQSAGMTPACLTEMRQRVAWSYYITGNTADARRLAQRSAVEGDGPFVAPAWWVAGLAAWRQQDWAGAASAFANVAARSADADMRSAGYYWAARANMANRQPQQVSRLLKAAAREQETFYGMLAAETLGEPALPVDKPVDVAAANMARVRMLPNVRIAATLAGIGRTAEADEALRYQAGISGDGDHDALIRLASDLSLPRTQLWLAQRSADGARSHPYQRYPMPSWSPAGGWRVDKALVFAHALQESRFQTDAVSSAGARGLMQVLPGTASLLAAATGEQVGTGDLSNPSVNMEYGQRYLEKLSGMGATGGLLAKVVAAYNAGPGAVDRWNQQVRDGGDPLLFIESLPFYETRAYVNVVLRNYWIYQMREGQSSPALTATAQGLWARFPGKTGELAVRMPGDGRPASAD